MTALNFIFPPEYARPAQVFSLFSVLMVGILFLSLNLYSKRHYFNIWGAAWLFYGLWLALSLVDSGSGSSWMQVLEHWSVGTAGLFFFWGTSGLHAGSFKVDVIWMLNGVRPRLELCSQSILR